MLILMSCVGCVMCVCARADCCRGPPDQCSSEGAERLIGEREREQAAASRKVLAPAASVRVLCFVRVAWCGGTERDEREPILISEHVFAVVCGAASSGNFPNER